jgi:(S)-citramalyl-CoA lyase
MKALVSSLCIVALAWSVLFVPGNRPDRFEDALASGADALVIDLEDSAASSAKDQARRDAIAFLATCPSHATPRIFRSNHIGTPDGFRDLCILVENQSPVDAIMLPKVETAAEIAIVARNIASSGSVTRIIALVETAAGFANADSIAGHPSVDVLAFDGADYAADTNARFSWKPLLFACSRLVQTAALSGCGMWDVPYLDIRDEAGLMAETTAARAVGFTSKLAIHPAQIAGIHASYRDSGGEIERARRIVAASQDAGGRVCMLDGRMIDRPIVSASLRVMHIAGRGPA